MAEMVTLAPISSPFVRFAGRYFDEARRFAAGCNFFIYQVALATFGVTACNVHYSLLERYRPCRRRHRHRPGPVRADQPFGR